ncbi:MAG: hypothetical protein HC837_20420 [Chloroflexaceae bacterium]|nr:hypothetical protein [Chloroflexaceae bacterium]
MRSAESARRTGWAVRCVYGACESALSTALEMALLGGSFSLFDLAMDCAFEAVFGGGGSSTSTSHPVFYGPDPLKYPNAPLYRGLWELPNTSRGIIIERRLGQNLPATFPTVDRFDEVAGEVTSIKSIDLTSRTYRSSITEVRRTVRRYINAVSRFNGRRWGRFTIRSTDIVSRKLELVIPDSGVNSAQLRALQRLARVYGPSRANPVLVEIIAMGPS